ncbi:MAG: SDR family NAD(P)-dependent oxidoreductase [Gammaproteobacteria bacterium]|nr:SDR family NAD(P)-dependent oxidoreductase [Gammaproteobacteria bacterium]
MLVTAASGGIGLALAQQLAERYPLRRLYLTTRDIDQHAALRALAAQHANCELLQVDLLSEADLARLAAAISAQDEQLGLVINAAGLLHRGERGPERRLQDLELDWMQQLFAVNALAPALLLKHLQPLLPRDQPFIIAMLSARVGSITDNRLGGWYSYRASKAALNQILRTAAIELRRHNRASIVIGLHPGTVATSLSAPFQSNVPTDKLFTPHYSASRLLKVLGQRKPADSGSVFDWAGELVPP